MKEFKVDKWVSINEDIRTLAQVKELDSDFSHKAKLYWPSENSTAWCSEMNHYKLWQPKAADWFWYTEDNGFEDSSVHLVSISKVPESWYAEPGKIFVITSTSDFMQIDNTFEDCEPFFGELPSALRIIND